MTTDEAWEWAVQFPGSDMNHIQPDEATARALRAVTGGTLLRRPATRVRWECVIPSDAT